MQLMWPNFRDEFVMLLDLYPSLLLIIDLWEFWKTNVFVDHLFIFAVLQFLDNAWNLVRRDKMICVLSLFKIVNADMHVWVVEVLGLFNNAWGCQFDSRWVESKFVIFQILLICSFVLDLLIFECFFYSLEKRWFFWRLGSNFELFWDWNRYLFIWDCKALLRVTNFNAFENLFSL